MGIRLIFIFGILLITCKSICYGQELRLIDWKTNVENVQSVGVSDTFKFDASPTDYNDIGAIDREIGNYFIDYVARCFKIIDSDATTITVVDLEYANTAPQSNRIGRVYQSVVNGDTLFHSVGGVDISVLDELSRWKQVARDNEYTNRVSKMNFDSIQTWNNSLAKTITVSDTTYWGQGGSYEETDPIYSTDSSFIKTGVRSWNSSLAKTIDAADTTWWGRAETDPKYATDSSFIKTGVRSWNSSIAKTIDAADTTRWAASSGIPHSGTEGYIQRMRNDSLVNSGIYQTTSGYVGIGTTSPTHKLHVNGSVRANQFLSYADDGGFVGYASDLSETGAIIFNRYTGTYLTSANTHPIRFFVNGSEYFRLTSSGYVGIGTTNPTYKLDVTGQIRQTNATSAILKADANGVITSATAGTDYVATEVDPKYATDSSFIKTGVRSWNSSLAKTIDAADTTWWGRAETDPYYSADSANIFLKTGTKAMTGNIKLNGHYISNDGDNEGAYLDNSGSLYVKGIGTVKLGIHGPQYSGFWLDGDTCSNYVVFDSYAKRLTFQLRQKNYGAYTSSPIRFDLNAPNYSILLSSSGYLGLGTVSPSYKLDVIGQIRQTNTTSAMLKSDANGAITSATAGTDYVATEVDPKYATDSSFIKTGVRSWNSSIAKTIDAADTTWWGTIVDTIYQRHDTIFWSQGGTTHYSTISTTSAPEIGDFYQGGYVFYVDPTKSWGLCAAPNELSSTYVFSTSNTSGSTNTSVGSGQNNTDNIIATLGSAAPAAYACYNYSYAGYSDWYLPAKDELSLIFTQLVPLGYTYGGSTHAKWSSSQYDASTSYYHDWTSSTGIAAKTTMSIYVIPIRTWFIGSDQTLPSGADGDIIYSNGGSWTALPIGSTGQILKVSSGLPSWQTFSGTGTVTSVGLSAPTGLTVSGSPVTSSGTLALSLTSGYSIPTTANQTNWTSGYTYRLTSASGTSPLTLTLSSNALTGSITQASSSASGYLSSTNWNTFNNKQTAYTNLSTIGALANGTGYLYNNGSGTFSYSTPSGSMTWPSSAGIAYYNGSSAWGTSITTSSGLAGALSDETGSGSAVFGTSPTLTTPNIGVATATSVNGLSLTSATDGFTVSGGTTSRTLTVTGANKSLSGTGTGIALSGAYGLTLDLSGTTSVTLPTSGTLATLAGAESLTNKSVNGVTLSTSAGSSYFLNGSGSYAVPPSGVGSSSSTQVLYNNSGSVGGSTYLTVNSSGGINYGANGTGTYFLYLNGRGNSSGLTDPVGGEMITSSIWNVYGTTSSMAYSTYPLATSSIWMGKIIGTIYNETDNTYQIVTYDLFVKGGTSYTMTEKERTGSSALSSFALSCTVNSTNFYCTISSFGSDATDICHVSIQYIGNIIAY